MDDGGQVRHRHVMPRDAGMLFILGGVAELVAVLELGSNATRCLLARVSPGVGFQVIDEERVQTRLGGGPPGTLPREAVDQTLLAVHRFLRRVRQGNGLRVLAVATAAVRDARNREHLLEPLRREEGVRVHVLGGSQEARLGAQAAVHASAVHDGLVADLGGSSLQLTRLHRGRALATASLPLGTVRTTRRFLHHDPPTPGELRALRGEVRRHLLRRLPAAGRSDELVGLGGTVRALARIHLGLHGIMTRSRHGLRVGQPDVTAIRERLAGLPLADRRWIPGLKAERADIIVAGAIVVEEVMQLGGYPAVIVCEQGVRDGLLLREAFTQGGVNGGLP